MEIKFGVVIHVPELNRDLQFDVTNAMSPVMISTGKLCEDDGFDYHWSAGEKDAVLLDPDGNSIDFITVHHVGIVESSVNQLIFRVASTRRHPQPDAVMTDVTEAGGSLSGGSAAPNLLDELGPSFAPMDLETEAMPRLPPILVLRYLLQRYLLLRLAYA